MSVPFPESWDSAPPLGGLGWIPVYSPPPGGKLVVVLLSAAVEGHWLHWIGGRTIPCPEPASPCSLCAGEGPVPIRWKGWFAALPYEGKVPGLAEVTEEAWKHCPVLREASRRKDCRGKILTLRRAPGGKRKTVDASVSAFRQGEQPELPEAFDVRAAVRQLWVPRAAGNPRLADRRGKGADDGTE